MDKNMKKNSRQINNDNNNNNVDIEEIKAKNPDKTVFNLAGTTFIIGKKY